MIEFMEALEKRIKAEFEALNSRNIFAYAEHSMRWTAQHPANSAPREFLRAHEESMHSAIVALRKNGGIAFPVAGNKRLVVDNPEFMYYHDSWINWGVPNEELAKKAWSCMNALWWEAYSNASDAMLAELARPWISHDVYMILVEPWTTFPGHAPKGSA